MLLSQFTHSVFENTYVNTSNSPPTQLNKLGEKNGFPQHPSHLNGNPTFPVCRVKICGVIFYSYLSLILISCGPLVKSLNLHAPYFSPTHPIHQQILLTLKHTQHLTTSFHLNCCHPNPNHHHVLHGLMDSCFLLSSTMEFSAYHLLPRSFLLTAY